MTYFVKEGELYYSITDRKRHLVELTGKDEATRFEDRTSAELAIRENRSEETDPARIVKIRPNKKQERQRLTLLATVELTLAASAWGKAKSEPIGSPAAFANTQQELLRAAERYYEVTKR